VRVDAGNVKIERLARGAPLLEALGWTSLRFWNDDVIRDIDNVCRHVVIVAGLAVAPATPTEELVI
jgi:very-short-patch-repair endonuclease